MKIKNEILFKQKKYLFIVIIFINLIRSINSVDTSLLTINNFNRKQNLYYINAMNNNKGDLYFEFWGEEDKIRYFIGINATTGEDIFFNNNKIYQIEAASISSTYHESIIMNNNNENNILSIDYNNIDFINIKGGDFSTNNLKNIFGLVFKKTTE